MQYEVRLLEVTGLTLLSERLAHLIVRGAQDDQNVCWTGEQIVALNA